MKTNQELAKDVQDAIQWEPVLRNTKIGVTAFDGVITLTGDVDNYLKKSKAEESAKGVTGVKAVVEEIDVIFKNAHDKTDNEIAIEAINALKNNGQIPHDRVKVKVENGWVTLEGNLPWNYQKEAARDAVRHLDGVKVFTNDIRVQPENEDELEQEAIQRALRRSAALEDQDIQVYVTGNKVTLNGVVNSLYQQDEASRIAWKAPGVTAVNNELAIDFRD
ncbi:BON domain-containing protein [Mucilaginibacter glaciei]|uniref:BON domain-containing protein n=1 Tax=Mucilaginibacter glaciei TaxID=2772109 RepID=A0A926NJ30_9SPHI|nr:BON domain-containing protein [Mucilaginibacter glaciei]MBD1393014.1 BON domain-containing protein [Mucilaginibacter glaciei]